MNELRWILLVAGLLLIGGIYAWGLRARRRAATPEPGRSTRVEPARTVVVAPEPVHDGPDEVSADELPADADAGIGPDAGGEVEVEPVPRRSPAAAARREPRLEPRLEPRFDPRVEPAPDTRRVEPRLEPDAPQPRSSRAAEPAAAATEPGRKASTQKIVALRIVAPGGGHFEGAQLLSVLHADGFTFGRYDIFHRVDGTGRPIVSLASLKEPGTFNLDTMADAHFRGVALFTVMPGPLPPVRAFDELIVTARALASTLAGQLQDERGGPLSLQRISGLREEVAEFERARGAKPGA